MPRPLRALWTLPWMGLLLTACVTINVYFPAAAAEAAADRLVREIYGEDASRQPAAPADAPAAPAEGSQPEPQSRLEWLDWLIPPAQAAADLDVSTPAIQRLQSAMKARHRQLESYYQSGALGMTRDGEITLRDLKAVPLRERARVQQLVAEENRDRRAMYEEIARANGHPEWEAEIRATFARRWVANAPKGWWYQRENGGWAQK